HDDLRRRVPRDAALRRLAPAQPRTRRRARLGRQHRAGAARRRLDLPAVHRSAGNAVPAQRRAAQHGLGGHLHLQHLAHAGRGAVTAHAAARAARRACPRSRREGHMKTDSRITPAMTVNTVMLLHPRTVAVFDRYGIDSCCGGALPIEEVARKHGLDLDALMAELDEAAGPAAERPRTAYAA